MPIVAVFQSPALTREKYEESIRLVTGGKTRAETPADWPVEGLLVHAAGEGKNGFRVVDVWTSQEAFDSFGEKLNPIMKSIGVELEPEVYEAHTLVSA